MDMLRYDGCWPERESSDSVAIDLDHGAPERIVTLRTVNESKGWRPTDGRWRSFCWQVVPSSLEVL